MDCCRGASCTFGPQGPKKGAQNFIYSTQRTHILNSWQMFYLVGLDMKITLTAILSCTGPQTAASKGAPDMVLFIRQNTWKFSVAYVLASLMVHENHTDSNFNLYIASDSSFKYALLPTSFIEGIQQAKHVIYCWFCIEVLIAISM